jgi:hypothetical protein
MIQQNTTAGETGRITRFTSSAGSLAKRWRWNDSTGKADKTTAAQLWAGSYQVEEFRSVGELASLVDSVTIQEAISASLPRDSTVAGTVTTNKRQVAGLDAGAKARTKSQFGLLQCPGILFLDHDAPAGQGGLDRDTLWQVLCAVCPELGSAGVVWKPSGSSHIFHQDSDLTGLRGQHLYVMIKDVSDTSRVVAVLAKRLWLAGHERIDVSASGALLIRGVLDTAPADAARLIFAGGADCEEPLRQDRGSAIVLSDGGWLDSRQVIPDLTAREEEAYQAMLSQERSARASDAAQARSAWTERQVRLRAPTLADRDRVTVPEAELRIRKACEAAHVGELLADFMLTCVHEDGSHETVAVADVLRAREKYHEVRCLCPLNPEHRGGAPDARLYLLSASPCLFDLDDSGQVFRLRMQKLRIEYARGRRDMVVSELVRLCVTSGEVFRGSAGAPVVVSRSRQKQLDVSGLINYVDVRASLFQWNSRGEAAPWDLNRDVAELVLHSLSSSDDLPQLQGVVTVPFPTPDGRIVAKPGFDYGTGLFLAMCPESGAIADELVAGMSLRDALCLTFEPFSAYRFTDVADAGAAVAAVFTALCRAVLQTAPGIVIDAPVQGSGKTSFMTALGILTEGDSPGVASWSSSEEERKKRLLASARGGANTVLFDNVVGVIKSPSVAAVLTSGSLRDRILGTSDEVTAQIRSLICFSGNNAALDSDLLRRVLQIRIDGGDRPTQRSFSFCPRAKALENRQKIAAAACVIWRAYFHAGMPVITKGDAGGFVEWNRLVRQMVLWLEREGLADALPFGKIADPATSMLADHTEADSERSTDAILLRALHELKGADSFTSRDVYDGYRNGENMREGPHRDLWEALTEIQSGKSKPLTSQNIGMILRHRRDRLLGGLKLISSPGSTAAWKVVAAAGPTAR